MKLEREAYATYIDASFGAGTPKWFLLGADLESASVELNPDIETVKNILGETSVKDNGYEPSMSVDPYKANPEDSIYPKIKEIAMQRKKGDACKTKILEVIIDPSDEEEHEAYTEDVMIKPTSYGGDTSGFAIPFNIHFHGNRKKGKATITSGVPEFDESLS